MVQVSQQIIAAAMFHSLHNCVTAFAGLGKGSGKTSAFGLALSEAQREGPTGIFTIGFEGGRNNGGSGKNRPPVWAAPGDAVITSAPLARAAGARLEVIEALPGRSAIGQLCVCRAARGGAVTLVGPEHFSQLAWAVNFVRTNNIAESVLIDGAGGRITQAGALPGCQLAYCARADGSDYGRVAEAIGLVSMLAALPPEDGEPGPGGGRMEEKGKLRLEGPLTDSRIEALGKDVAHISIGTFCDCFLGPASFRRASLRYRITVRHQVPLLGFVVALKNVRPGAFEGALPGPARIMFNPFEI